jgi:hypothetical protein
VLAETLTSQGGQQRQKTDLEQSNRIWLRDLHGSSQNVRAVAVRAGSRISRWSAERTVTGRVAIAKRRPVEIRKYARTITWAGSRIGRGSAGRTIIGRFAVAKRRAAQIRKYVRTIARAGCRIDRWSGGRTITGRAAVAKQLWAAEIRWHQKPRALRGWIRSSPGIANRALVNHKKAGNETCHNLCSQRESYPRLWHGSGWFTGRWETISSRVSA